jgi:hypothetical protein
MKTFPAYAINFELYPRDGQAARHLMPLLDGLARVDFAFSVADAAVNQGQTSCDFDSALEKAFLTRGATRFSLPLPKDVRQELDFAFTFGGRTVAVEIEKANREKILRDILKSHTYLHAGADFAVVVLPKNYAHTHGVWNLFQFGVERYNDCRRYGFGTQDKFTRILLLGYDQFDTATNRLLSKLTRQEMRTKAAAIVEEI